MTSAVRYEPALPADAHVRTGRRPWVAFILGMLVPGLGHFHAGQPVAALVILLLDAAAIVLVAYAMPRAPFSPLGMVLPYVLYIAFRIGQAIAAARVARRADAGLWRPRGARYGMLLAAAFVLAAAGGLARADWIENSVVQSFRTPSITMAPTLLIGDLFFATPVRPSDVRRDMIIGYLRDDELYYLSRIVGLPGDTLAMQAGRLVRNGTQVAEPYASIDSASPDVRADEFAWQGASLARRNDSIAYAPSSRNWGPLVVPEGHAFVLGDNRDNSLDSRYLGFIPIENIQREPRRIYFSLDADSWPIRWSRIGKDIHSPRMR